MLFLVHSFGKSPHDILIVGPFENVGARRAYLKTLHENHGWRAQGTSPDAAVKKGDHLIFGRETTTPDAHIAAR